jgi:hypothetical protein
MPGEIKYLALESQDITFEKDLQLIFNDVKRFNKLKMRFFPQSKMKK